MTALPLHRKFVKATENYFFAGFPRKRLVTLSESKKHIPISFFFFFSFSGKGFSPANSNNHKSIYIFIFPK